VFEHLMTEKEEAGRAHMFSEGVGDDVMGTLVLRYYLVVFVGPTNMVVLKVDMAGFRRYEWCLCQFYG